MRTLGQLLMFLFAAMVVGAASFIFVRASGGEGIGPAVALCPGPDEYGYECSSEAQFVYVDASNDTFLYRDDDVVVLELPFTFTFYGTEYDEIVASSNGNLQFTTRNVAYENRCLTPEPAAGMGDMIAPYWDDLSLAFEGFLQTEVVGEAPDRVFVVEWDEVPTFGGADDQVTFEVQLFEGSNDIVFLYKDVQTLEGPAGSLATIGIQSEEQAFALQASCNQFVVYNGTSIEFIHPEEPVPGAGLTYVGKPNATMPAVASDMKGRGTVIVETLNERGKQGLEALRATWLNQRPRLASEWLWADLDGAGGQELIALSGGMNNQRELVELAVAAREPDGHWRLLWQTWPLARQEQLVSLTFVTQAELTGDGGQEVLLRDPTSGALLALMKAEHDFDLVTLPGRCYESILLSDEDGDGRTEIIVTSCQSQSRQSLQWSGAETGFTVDR